MAAKNKKAVMAYLSPELERFVADYCESKGLTFSKDGEPQPRLGTGIVELLESLRLGDNTLQPEVQDPDHGLSKRLSEMESKMGKFGEGMEALTVRVANGETSLATAKDALTDRLDIVEELLDSKPDYSLAIAAINARLDALESKDDGLPSVVETKPLQGIVEGVNVPEKIQEPIVSSEPAEAETLESMMAKYPNGLTAKQLAHRLGCHPQGIQQNRKKDIFPQWSAGLDPDGIPWESRPPAGKKKPGLFPIIPPEK
jgi:hypothetical protein